MTIRQIALLAITLFLTPALKAGGIPVEPGLWEMTTTMTMPMFPQPRVTTVTECMQKSEISMEELNSEDMDVECVFNPAQVEGNTMKWSFDCPVEGGTSHGEWEATSGGDSVSGKGLITMTLQGQSMEMNMSWNGRRVGDCP